jgi:hypothetical protein
MTAKTPSALGTESAAVYADGQAAASIFPARIRPVQQDIIDSYAPWDDPSNAIGLGAPAILRGTISLTRASGVTVGTGQATAVRQANATAVQAALDAAAANNKFVEFEPGTIEFSNSTGLYFGSATSSSVSNQYTGFTFRGSTEQSILRQFTATAPVLNIGDFTNVAGSIRGLKIDGLLLDYGVTPSGTSAYFLRFGGAWGSSFRNLRVGTLSVLAYDALHIDLPGGNDLFFSNVLDTCIIFGATHALFYFNQDGSTDNTFVNCYFNNNFAGPAAVTNGFNFSFMEGVFVGCNLEGCSAGRLMTMGSCDLDFLDCHWEANVMTGFDPSFWYVTGSRLNVLGGATVNPKILAANVSGQPRIVSSGANSEINFTGHRMLLNAGAIDTGCNMFDQDEFVGSPVSTNRGGVSADNIQMTGFEGHLSMDAKAGRATYGDIVHLQGYLQPRVFPRPKGAVVHNPATNFISAGCNGEQSTILFDTAITATVDIALSHNMMLGSDKGNTIGRPTGDQCLVIRDGACTGNFNIVVHDGTIGGTTIGTFSGSGSAGTSQTFGYNGTSWAAI